MKVQSLAMCALALSTYAMPAIAQEEPDIAICHRASIVALREKTADVKDVFLDLDSVVVAKAKTDIEGIPVRAVVTGDAYLLTDMSDKPRRMVCLVGDKSNALMTFFTAN